MFLWSIELHGVVQEVLVLGKCLESFMSIFMTEAKRRENGFSKRCEGKEKRICTRLVQLSAPKIDFDQLDR